MRTISAVDRNLLAEAKSLSGAKTRKETIEKALKEFIGRRRSMKLFDLEGKVEKRCSPVEEVFLRG